MAKQYNYQPGYPIDTSPGGTETHLTAFQKIKNEFERLYRVINAEFSAWSATLDGWKKMFEDFKQQILDRLDALEQTWEDWKKNFDTIWKNYTSSMDAKIDSISVVPVLDYRNAISASIPDGSNREISSFTWTVPEAGALYIVYNISRQSMGSSPITLRSSAAVNGATVYGFPRWGGFSQSSHESGGENSSSTTYYSYFNSWDFIYVEKGDVVTIPCCELGTKGTSGMPSSVLLIPLRKKTSSSTTTTGSST